MSLPALYINFDELAIDLVNKFKEKIEFSSSIFQIQGRKEIFSFFGEEINIQGQYCIRRINISPFYKNESVKVELENYIIADIEINQSFDIYFDSVFLIDEFTNFKVNTSNLDTIITLEVIRI
jgi:hypothetical protein